jgi:hypothetical protein
MSLVPIPIQTVNNTPLYLKFAVGVICGGIWVAMAFTHVQDTTGLLDFIKAILVGLSAHLLTTSYQPKQVLPSQPSSTTQQ